MSQPAHSERTQEDQGHEVQRTQLDYYNSHNDCPLTTSPMPYYQSLRCHLKQYDRTRDPNDQN